MYTYIYHRFQDQRQINLQRIPHSVSLPSAMYFGVWTGRSWLIFSSSFPKKSVWSKIQKVVGHDMIDQPQSKMAIAENRTTLKLLTRKSSATRNVSTAILYNLRCCIKCNMILIKSVPAYKPTIQCLQIAQNSHSQHNPKLDHDPIYGRFNKGMDDKAVRLNCLTWWWFPRRPSP